MEKYAVKLVITNPLTGYRVVDWYFSNKEDSIEKWIKKKKETEKEWNGKKREFFFNFNKYDTKYLLNTEIIHMDDLTVNDIIDIIKCNHF
jgi:hypothetical protein